MLRSVGQRAPLQLQSLRWGGYSLSHEGRLGWVPATICRRITWVRQPRLPASWSLLLGSLHRRFVLAEVLQHRITATSLNGTQAEWSVNALLVLVVLLRFRERRRLLIKNHTALGLDGYRRRVERHDSLEGLSEGRRLREGAVMLRQRLLRRLNRGP